MPEETYDVMESLAFAQAEGLWPPLETTKVSGDEEISSLISLNKSRQVPDTLPLVLAEPKVSRDT